MRQGKEEVRFAAAEARPGSLRHKDVPPGNQPCNRHAGADFPTQRTAVPYGGGVDALSAIFVAARCAARSNPPSP
jgi:hypothetical protein